MRLILVRHGRPDEEDAVSPRDPPLNADGRRQAHSVADWLASEGVTRIVASPLRRAQQTAVPLAERLGLDMDQAFGVLRDYARARNLRLSELARGFIDGSQAITRPNPEHTT